MGAPESTADLTDPAVGVDTDGPTGGRSRPHTWIILVLVAVAVALGAAAVVLVVVDRSGVHDGPGTATFNWTPVATNSAEADGTPPPQRFTGDIDGEPLAGTSTLVLPPSSFFGTDGRLPTGPVPAFRYRGTLAGTPFNITLDYHFPAVALPTDTQAAQAAEAGLRITVAGTYGRSAVRATVTVPAVTGPTAAHPATFTGTVGHWKVHGTIPTPTGTAHHQTATSHFVISG